MITHLKCWVIVLNPSNPKCYEVYTDYNGFLSNVVYPTHSVITHSKRWTNVAPVQLFKTIRKIVYIALLLGQRCVLTYQRFK